MSKFKVGEVVIINCSEPTIHNGKETEILEVRDIGFYHGYITSITPDDIGKKGWKEESLRKLPDGNTVTEWRDCVFKPTEVTA